MLGRRHVHMHDRSLAIDSTAARPINFSHFTARGGLRSPSAVTSCFTAWALRGELTRETTAQNRVAYIYGLTFFNIEIRAIPLG